MDNTSQVIRFIGQHDLGPWCGFVRLTDDGRLVVRSSWTNDKGEHGFEEETIEPTMRAARTWLGY